MGAVKAPDFAQLSSHAEDEAGQTPVNKYLQATVELNKRAAFPPGKSIERSWY